jgi:hypothetical protein
MAFVLAGAGCASGPSARSLLSSSSSSGVSSARVLDVVVDGRRVRHGPAAYTVRETGDATTRVITMPGIGEVLVAPDACRFARLERGGAVTVWRHAGPCAQRSGTRLCFARAAFADEAAVVRGVVDGCVEQNEIFLDRVGDDDAVVGVGPRTYIERCVDVPAKDPSYVAVVSVDVDDNDRPWRGVRLRHDGDAFGVCFLSRTTGRYRIEVNVEDPRRRMLVLEGAVDEL